MVINNVNVNNTGLYECQASVGQEMLATKHTLLVVLSEDQSDLHHTTFTFTKKGGELSLDCSDLEGEGSETDWTKPGPARRKQVLVDKEGSGVYYCAVTGSTHVSHVSPRVPQVTPRVKHVYTARGRGARLECLVTAAPVPVITWTRVNNNNNDTEMVRSG